MVLELQMKIDGVLRPERNRSWGHCFIQGSHRRQGDSLVAGSKKKKAGTLWLDRASLESQFSRT